jgi:tripartite-type tricarboxylate transporter receptor subunit TctC
MAPALTDLLSGHISVLFSDPLVMLPHVQQGKVRALGVTSKGRYPSAPEIPTLAEAGLPGYESTLWYGVLAPGGVPAPVVAALHAGIVQAMQEPDVRERLAKLGTSVIADTPEHFAAFIRAELAKWATAKIGTRVAEPGAVKN